MIRACGNLLAIFGLTMFLIFFSFDFFVFGFEKHGGLQAFFGFFVVGIKVESSLEQGD